METACQRIAGVAIPRANTLSGAWLRHAAQGEFGRSMAFFGEGLWRHKRSRLRTRFGQAA